MSARPRKSHESPGQGARPRPGCHQACRAGPPVHRDSRLVPGLGGHRARGGHLAYLAAGLDTGLLQTPAYARAILASWWLDTDGDIEAKLAARTGRQAILDRDDPPDLCALLDESVLHRCIGSAAIMAGQLEHLTQAARRPNVTIQLVPEQAGLRWAVRGVLGRRGSRRPAVRAPGDRRAGG